MLPIRLVFMGTPDLACASLQALVSAPGFSTVAVVTQPDRPKGRDLKCQPPPVKTLALSYSLPVLQPERARDHAFQQQLAEFRPDLIAVAAFGQILPQSILDLPRFGCLNVHTSLLPKYRGASPIQRAILNDDPETGVTIMRMDTGLDTGDILAQEKTPVLPEDNAQTLHDRLARIGANLMVQTIRGYVTGQIKPRPQPSEGVVYAPRISKEDGRIDWTQSSRRIWNQVRGLVPWPSAWTHLPALSPGTRGPLLKIWEAQPLEDAGPPGTVVRAENGHLAVACGSGALQINQLQREGARRLDSRSFLSGNMLKRGDRLG